MWREPPKRLCAMRFVIKMQKFIPIIYHRISVYNFSYRFCSCKFTVDTMASKRKLSTADDDSVGKQQKLSNFFRESEPATENGVANVIVKPATGLSTLLTEKSWKSFLKAEFTKPYFKEIEAFLQSETSKGKLIYPPRSLIFNALNLTPLDEVKVVIIGQDPYHGIGQAHGLSFSVPPNIGQPPSLKNIFTELTNDIPGFQKPRHGCLEAWAKRGVLLLNATLTVEAHNANSHAQIGWQKFTDSVIKLIANECKDVVFLLWGGFAHKKAVLIDISAKRGHLVIKTAHPSPLSAVKFFGCKCFSETNEALKNSGKGEIDWSLE